MFAHLTVILLHCFVFSSAFEPYLTLYGQHDESGNSVTLRRIEPNLLSLAPSIIPYSHRFCVRGHWVHYSENDYIGFLGWTQNMNEGVCSGRLTAIGNAGSIRFLGPEDNSVHSLSFYPQTEYEGTQVIISGPAYANLFPPKSLFIIGTTTWTLYSGPNFDGTATCLRPISSFSALPNLNATLLGTRSVLRGCDLKIDNYVDIDTEVASTF